MEIRGLRRVKGEEVNREFIFNRKLIEVRKEEREGRKRGKEEVR